MTVKVTRVHREVVHALKATGLDYKVENGTKHEHFYLMGELVGTASRGSSPSRNALKIIASIKRIARRYESR